MWSSPATPLDASAAAPSSSWEVSERKLDKSAQEWERGVNIAYSKESFTDKWHYIITNTPGHRDFIKSTRIATLQVTSKSGFVLFLPTTQM